MSEDGEKKKREKSSTISADVIINILTLKIPIFVFIVSWSLLFGIKINKQMKIIQTTETLSLRARERYQLIHQDSTVPSIL